MTSEIDTGNAAIRSADPQMRSLFSRVRRLSQVRLPILIHGESGVGKELIARALHANAPWRTGPFVPINCGAFPAGLVESELFGHERGAFSGAAETKMGLLETACGGTIFLDEIGELQLELQARLLRFLDDYLVRRVGGVSSRPVNIRVVSATNRNLQALVDEGRFRDDLLHRLHGGLLEVPPLRDRRPDLLQLARGFLVDARERNGDAPVTLSVGGCRACAAPLSLAGKRAGIEARDGMHRRYGGRARGRYRAPPSDRENGGRCRGCG